MTRDTPSRLVCLPCLDSPELATTRQQELRLSRPIATELGTSAVEISERGCFVSASGEEIDISAEIRAARKGKLSLAPDDPLLDHQADSFSVTEVQVTNETTLGAAWRLTEGGRRPLALNFANGIHPGGGFLHGALAQEEVLCRSSALYTTLVGDRMYQAHRKRSRPDSTDWAIYSPDVPVFRADNGRELERPWLLSFITCAAPYAPEMGQPESGDLLQQRIHRVLSIARAFGYSSLVLGAWGCGAFANDPARTARDFRAALEGQFSGAFSHVVFAIVDWSPERRFLRPFRDVFAATA